MSDITPDANKQPARGLLQVLGLGFGLAVLVGNTIGMGILRTPGEIAAHLPSLPLYLLVWVAGAAYALLGALTVAELGAMHPRSGGLYPLVARGLGPFAGFVSGWADWMATCCSMAAGAIVFAEYLGPLAGLPDGHAQLVACCVVILFAALLWQGIRIGDRVQQLTSLLKAVALLGLAAVMLLVEIGPRAAPVAATPGPLLPIGLALVTAAVLALQGAIFTYDGWTGPVYFAEEARHPGRDVPRAMIGGVLLVLAIYLVLNLAFVRVLSLQEMAGDPFVAATAAARLFGPIGDQILRVLMLISLLATICALLLMASRIPFAMACDGLLPARVRKVNAGGTPVASLALSTLLALGFILSNTFATVLALLAFFFVANYALVFTSYFVLRRREPLTPRPFRTPGYPWVPGLALIGSIGFLLAALVTDRDHSLIALTMVGLSWPLYAWSTRARGRID